MDLASRYRLSAALMFFRTCVALKLVDDDDDDDGIYTPKIILPYKFFCGYWLFFFLFDPRQIVVDFENGMTS